MTRDGLVERGAASGEETRISSRDQDFELRRARDGPDSVQYGTDRGNSTGLHAHRSQGTFTGRQTEAADGYVQAAEPVADGNTFEPEENRQAEADGHVPDHPAAPIQEAAPSGASGPYIQDGRQHFHSRLPAFRGSPQPESETQHRPGQHGTRYQQRFTQEAEGTPRRPSKLEFTADELPPEPPGHKLTQARKKAERAEQKLEAVQSRLPSYRKLRMETQSDPATGKVVKRLKFEKEAKPQAAHVKGPVPFRPVKAGAGLAVGYAHRKLYQAEDENVGLKAAHRTEIAAEGAARSAYHAHKTAPYRRASRMQKKVSHTSAKAAYQQALHDHPELKKKALARLWQKQKLKRQYAKAAREAKRTGQAAKKTAVTTEKIAEKVVLFVKRHPVVFGIIALLLLLVFLISSVFTSCSNMGMSTMGGVLASSYLAEDADIDQAELAYTEWETDLQMEIDRAEADHPGYDEYRYQVGDIGHNPYELMGYLTAAYQNFTYSQIQGILRELFEEQYTLAFVEETEIRYRTETEVDPVTGEETQVEVPYEWHILNINLTARSFSELIVARMDAQQRELCEIMLQTKGNRQYVANVFGESNWLPYVTSYYGYRVHPISGEKNYHKGVDIGLPQGTEILAGHDGVVAQMGDAGGYGLVVVLEGEAYEGHTLTTKYAHCSQLLVSAGQEVKKGDVIAKVGNTGDSTGPHLHLEVLLDGRYLNPLYFADTGDDGSAGLPGTPGGVAIPAYPGEPMDDPTYGALMEEAQKHLGKPYVFGAKGPNSFDCSGFVCWSLSKSGIKDIATNAQGLFNASTPVSRENARPGDLIFFHSTYSTANTVTHVGIYIGNGQMIHAGSPIQYASIDTSYWTQHFYAFGRIH